MGKASHCSAEKGVDRFVEFSFKEKLEINVSSPFRWQSDQLGRENIKLLPNTQNEISKLLHSMPSAYWGESLCYLVAALTLCKSASAYCH